MDSSALDTLHAFRRSLYSCLLRRADALFELTDAILTAGAVPSPVHLSLQPSHRRGWDSLYAALCRGRLDTQTLRGLLAEHRLQSDGGEERPLVYAMDVSVWPRCDAEASPDRAYYYHPNLHSAGQPIVAGWAYQLVAELSFERNSWVAPVDIRRLRPEEDANDVAAKQVEALIYRLPERGVDPLFVFDAGYDPVRLQRQLEQYRVQILVRLHSGRTFYADPPALESRPVGRPHLHGEKFACKDPSTWPTLVQRCSPEARTTAKCAYARGRDCTPRREERPSATERRRLL
jgi:hypothetical protein